MSRRSSLDNQQATIRALQREINHLQKLNNSYKALIDKRKETNDDYIFLKKEKKKQYQRVKQATNGRYCFFLIILLLLFVFERNMQQIEKKDKWLLNTSYEQIFHIIKLQIEAFIKAPHMTCIFIISFFNFISLIYCQVNFPCPTLLFISLFIQAFLGLISIILPEFAIFVIFLVTSWMVPVALHFVAKKLVSVIIYNGVFFLLANLDYQI
jgi:membrane-associated HD superfamily phosphohydrolase